MSRARNNLRNREDRPTATAVQDYVIRPYRPADAQHLPAVEVRAAQLFTEHGHADLAATPAMEADAFDRLAAQRRTFVAAHVADGPVGFVITSPIDGFLHIEELSVAPEHGRRGLGGRLLRTVIGESRALGLEGVSLSTFRDVPFNAPFYERHGFAEWPLDAAPEALKERFLIEIPPDVSPQSRLLMLRRNSNA
ncbi:GNAT family N-acetyltransferase [Nitratireductor aquimarinus]|uniref:GNAT family N-acetyltransferase n=1 Tax=Nitratireductor aquimarinus TaxID=889300 RepID=A0ABU4AIZ7_9HYPH|nr:GNAT family N-acetyltransferase [Nitratireductor aquimarinus]MDV6226116.1 GNAT family N-acetyltransferase [Nitratireductor aquimarinus]